ncbi:MAG: MATE family efflux transporter [Clostridia bacterium]|nr:MATE family efflux transporter [Clostridia bacterium]
MQNNAPAENKMGVMPIPKLIINMSLPMILSMLVQALYNVVDSFFVARYDQAALTAVSLAFPAQNLMIGFATGTAVGVNALLSRALGAKDTERANQVAENGVFLALVCYVLFLLFGLFGVRAFFAAQTEVETFINYGVDYLTTICCFSFGVFGQIMFERLMQSTGRTIYTMFTQGTGAIINIILDPIFILGLRMGAKGAAIATVIGQIIAFGMAVFLNHRKNVEIRLDMRKFRPNLPMIGRIYAIGIPSILMIAIGSVMTFLMNIILITYTAAQELAATVFGVYFKLNSFVFMPVFGLNNGIIPIIAYNYGAQNRRRMVQAIKMAVIYAAGYILLGLLAFMLIPGPLLKIFNASEEMLRVGIPAIRIIGSTFLFAGTCIAMGSVFQALGYGVYSMIVSFARQLVALLPSAYLLARLGLRTGIDWLVWLSFPIAEVASLITTLILFSRLYKNVIKPIPEGAQ